MNFHGRIVAADSTEKTITIECDTRISGITMGDRAILSMYVQPHSLRRREEKTANDDIGADPSEGH